MASNSINTSLSSLAGLRILTQHNHAVQSAFEKISSGSRINGAKDDAAGLAIANTFQTQINGLGVAAKNANDGISFAQTAESALGDMTDSLQRIRDLSVQASNATYSASDRAALQKEIDQLKDQVGFIAETTTFNGKKVLSGGLDALNFQVGANGAETVSISRFDAAPTSLGKQPGSIQSRSDRLALQATELGTQGIQAGDSDVGDITSFTIKAGNGESINIADAAFGGPINTVNSTSALKESEGDQFGAGAAKALANRINSVRESGESGFETVYASARTQFKASDLVSADYAGIVDTTKAPSTSVGAGSLKNGDLAINGVKIGPVAFEDKDSSGTLTDAINAKTATTGVAASVDTSGGIVLSAEDGRDIVIDTASAKVSNTLFGGGNTRFSAAFTDLRTTGQVTVSANETLSFGGSSNAITGFDDLSLEGTQNNVQAQGTVAQANVSTPEAAFNTINSLDSALEQIGSFRAELGAVQTRLSGTVRNIGSSQESLAAARSRIADTDYAKQTAELTRDMIKQRAGISIQAQANAQSEQTLRLLGA